ncbi:hypothetical protein Gogos_018135, partial [Gossypium gossypioides]|nr:hypothetical protein [Gossypium gossypioides]
GSSLADNTDGVPKRFFRDTLFKVGSSTGSSGVEVEYIANEDDIDILDDYITRMTVDGIPAIQFSERVHKLMEASMAITVVLKLLGRRIGLNPLPSRAYAPWKPNMRFNLMIWRMEVEFQDLEISCCLMEETMQYSSIDGVGSHGASIHSFSHHDIMKLQESTFVLWQHQILLIVDGYSLTNFVTSSVITPPPLALNKEGSWFQILLIPPIDSKTNCLPLVVSITKVYCLKHSLKKGHFSMNEYLAKIKSTCDLLSASGHDVSDEKQASIILVSLSVEFDSILIFVSYVSESL